MSLYLCDACNEGIPSHKARIHCEVCADYDACASCFVVGNSSKNHNPTHRTTLVKQSGSIQIPPATEAQGRDAYTRPPPPYTFQATPAQIQTNSGSVWSAFFSPMDWKPAEPYIALMNGFWSVLDDRRAGFLTPETLTSFYEAMGIEDNLNIWKRAYQAAYGNGETGQADRALKAAFDSSSIQHSLGRRQHTAGQPTSNNMSLLTSSFTNLLSGGTMNAATSGTSQAGLMPLITFTGFVDVLAIDLQCDPDKGWIDITRAARYYNLPILRERGEIPRAALPDVAVQSTLSRVDKITQQTLQASHMAAMIKHQGEQNAIDLLDDTTYVYRYY